MKHQQAARSGRPSPAKLALELAGTVKAMSTDQRGVAAIEFGVFSLFFVSRTRQRRGRHDVHLPADGGRECDAGCSPGSVEGVRFAEAAGYGKLSRTNDGYSERAGKHLAWYGCFSGVRLTVRGILLRQFIKRAAICQRCFIQTSRLYGCGYAELATRRLYSGTNDIYVHSDISWPQYQRHFPNADQQNSAREIGLNVRNRVKSLRLDQQGTAAVEFAIIAPMFIALTVGTLALCLALFLIGSLHYAVQESARCASVKTTICSDSTTTIAYAQSHYFGPAMSPTFTYAAAACGSSVSASISYSLDLGLKTYTIPLSATACFP